MTLPDWLVESGIGEFRAVLADDDDAIIESRIELAGTTPAGAVIQARLVSIGTNGRNAVASDSAGREYLLPRGAASANEGQTVTIVVTREAMPGSEPWKRPLARLTDAVVEPVRSLEHRLCARPLPIPAAQDQLKLFGWDDLIDEARTGIVAFEGGELRIVPTPAMTLIDVDGQLPPDTLAVAGAAAAARAIRRLDIGGSIGIDLPTTSDKAARKRAAAEIDAILPQPFERTAVNGFGFVQIVRPRLRPSLVELAQDRASFEARALARRVAFDGSGARRIVAHPAVIAKLEEEPGWIEALSRQLGGTVGLRPDPSLPMCAGYAEDH